MRTLTSTLTAKQKQLEGLRPAIKLDVSDRPVEIPRWDWAAISVEAVGSCHGGAAVAADGAVVRVRVKPDGSLQTARFANPSTDDWTAWHDWGGGYSASAQCSIGVATDSGLVIVAYVSGSHGTLYYRVSTDYGVNYGAEQTYEVEAVGSRIYGLALCGGAGFVYMAWSVDAGGAEPNDTLRVDRYSAGGGAWGGAVIDGQTFGNVTSVGTCLDGSAQRVVMGGASGLKRRDYIWGTGWQPEADLLALAAGSGFSLDWPRLGYSADGSGRYWYSFLESWTIDVAGSRQWIHYTPDADVIGEGVLFATNRGYGWDLLKAGAYWYAVTAMSHYRCPAYTGAAAQRADLGADVVAFEIDEPGDNRASRARVWLRNDDGRYATPGSGTYAMVREGSRAVLGLGYTTGAGVESVWLSPFWVESWRHVEGADGAAYLEVELGDAWRFLDRCLARFQMAYQGLSFGQIAAKLLHRVTSTTLSGVGGLGIVADTFAIQPGESIGVVLRRLLEQAGVSLRFGTAAVSGDPGHWDACVPAAVVKGSGASSYSFGTLAGHPILRAEYADRRQAANMVEVYGLGYWDWKRDLQHATDAGHVFFRRETDWHLDSAADVGDRRDRLHNELHSHRVGGWLETLPALGCELYDVVDVTAPRAGLSSAVRRVALLRWEYDSRGKGISRQRIGLGAV